MRPKDQMLRELNMLIKEMLEMRYRGGDHARLAHAQGLVDGYMRALLEAQMVTRDELLAIIREQRTVMDGPAVRALPIDEIEATVAA